jgi:hypothetical protein
MNLYLITQQENRDYDTYDSAVVAAKSEQDARSINPSSFVTHITEGEWMGMYEVVGARLDREYVYGNDGWISYADIDKVEVEYLGETTKPRGVVLASFNAG